MLTRRPWTFPTATGTGVRYTAKRACNGCGNDLGDANARELNCALHGMPLPDVRRECVSCLPTLPDELQSRLDVVDWPVPGDQVIYRTSYEWRWLAGIVVSVDPRNGHAVIDTGRECLPAGHGAGRHRWLLLAEAGQVLHALTAEPAGQQEDATDAR